MNPHQLAKITGLSAYTLRYYEKMGLILDVKRDSNGHRLYSKADIEWIEFLKKLKATGMPLANMKTFAQLRKRGDCTVGERIKLLENHYKNVKKELEEVSGHLNKIKEKIQFYQKMKKSCKQRLT